MAVAMACAVGRGARAVVCASTGNTAASAAAYAARAGIEALDPAPGRRRRRREARADAGRRGGGRFRSRARSTTRCAWRRRRPTTATSSSTRASTPTGSPASARRSTRSSRRSGSAPDILALPYGGGGNTVAYRSGFEVEGVVPRIVSGEARERQTTIATAIRIGEPVHARRRRGRERRDRDALGRRDPRRLVRPGPARRSLLRARERRRARRPAPSAARRPARPSSAS